MPRQRSTSKIIITDARVDESTREASVYLENAISDRELWDNFEVTYLRGEDDTRENYESSVNSNTVMHLGLGHAEDDAYAGWDNKDIINDSTDPKYVRNMVHYLVACNAGKVLGKLLIRKGASAFIGWDDAFRFVSSGKEPDKDPLLKSTVEPAFRGFNVLIRGGTVKDAYDEIRKAYTVEYNKWKGKNPLLAGAIAWNKKHLVLYGDHNAVIRRIHEPNSDDNDGSGGGTGTSTTDGVRIFEVPLESGEIEVEIVLHFLGYSVPLKLKLNIDKQMIRGRIEPSEVS